MHFRIHTCHKFVGPSASFFFFAEELRFHGPNSIRLHKEAFESMISTSGSTQMTRLYVLPRWFCTCPSVMTTFWENSKHLQSWCRLGVLQPWLLFKRIRNTFKADADLVCAECPCQWLCLLRIVDSYLWIDEIVQSRCRNHMTFQISVKDWRDCQRRMVQYLQDDLSVNSTRTYACTLYLHNTVMCGSTFLSIKGKECECRMVQGL